MEPRQYGDFVVYGGHVHAGDTVLNVNISGELVETANSCRLIDAALARLLDPPTYLAEIRSDIEELLNAIDNIQACIDENSINEALTATRIQSNLLDLWMACRTHKQALVDFETVIKTSNPTSPLPHGRTPHVQYAGLRGALRGLRRRLNTSIAILHLSTLQNMRLASEQHWSHLRRQIENLQEQHENQTLARLPRPLPISQMNLSRLELPEDPGFGIKRLLHTNPPTLRSSLPSMQLSSEYSSSMDRTETFISAMEYHSSRASKAASFLSPTTGAIRLLQNLMSKNARTGAGPEVTTLHARTTTLSSSWRRRPWTTPHPTSISRVAPGVLLSLQRYLCDHGYSLLQPESELQYRKDNLNNLYVFDLLKKAESRMLSVFAESFEVDEAGQKEPGPEQTLRTTRMRVLRKRPVSPKHSDRGQVNVRNENLRNKCLDRSPHRGRITLLLDDSDLETIKQRETWPIDGIVLVEGRINTVESRSEMGLQTRTSVIPF